MSPPLLGRVSSRTADLRLIVSFVEKLQSRKNSWLFFFCHFQPRFRDPSPQNNHQNGLLYERNFFRADFSQNGHLPGGSFPQKETPWRAFPWWSTPRRGKKILAENSLSSTHEVFQPVWKSREVWIFRGHVHENEEKMDILLHIIWCTDNVW